MGSVSDADLLVRSVREPAAFARIFDRHAPEVMHFLVRRMGDETGRELLGEVFRIAFEGRQRYDPERPSAIPWLIGIARNLCLRQHRSSRRRERATARLHDEPAPSEPDEDTIIAVLDARALLPTVTAAIGRLPPGERDVLILRVWQELDYREIADRLAIPVGTVRSRLHRARARLREPDPASGQEQEAVQSAQSELLERGRTRLMALVESAPDSEYLHQGIVPQLPYEDVGAAIAFLCAAFGFEERADGRVSTSDGKVVHAEVRIGHSIIMLGSQGGHGVFTPRSSGSASQVLSVYVDDVDAHWARARGAGAEIVEEPTDKFWGDRVYEAEDLAGHRWRFHEHTGRTFEWNPEEGG